MAKRSHKKKTVCDDRAADHLAAANIIRALNHPLRRQVLQELAGREASPRDLADTLCKPLSNVSYHVRVLLDLGLLKLERTKQVRGSMQHFYTSDAQKNEQLRSFLALSKVGNESRS